MPRNGSGVFSQPAATAAVSGATESSAAFNTLVSDIADALTDSLSKSGNGAATADLSMGNHKLTNLAAGASAADALRYDQLVGVYQLINANLTTWAGLAPTANGQSLVTAANYAAMVTLLGLVIGTNVQAFDAQLSSSIPQNSKSAAYTTVLSDGEKHILHPSADTTARTFTIDSNANVAYPVGTAITFVNQHSAGVVTIAITSDTLRLAGAGTTGSRTLAADGIATALKITSTEWIISGTNLT